MTERYIVDDAGTLIDMETRNMYELAYEVVDLLNEQHEQIEDLKDVNVRCCNEYSYFHKRMMELEKENEQLKSDIKLHIDDSEKYRELSIKFDNQNKELITKNALLEKENEQLKKEKELLIQALSDASRNTVDILLKGDVE